MANHENAIDARGTFITLMLREDHQKLKELFDQFGKTTNKKRETEHRDGGYRSLGGSRNTRGRADLPCLAGTRGASTV